MFDILRTVTPSGVVVLNLKGSLDADTVHILESELQEDPGSEKENIILDLSNLEYISSAGVGTFIGCIGAMREKCGHMIFLNPSANIMELFELLGFTKLFRIMTDKKEAIEALSHG